MKRSIWKGLALLLLCAALLSGCGSKTQVIGGLVTELQTGADGELTAFVIRADSGKDIGVLLTGDTSAFPAESGAWTLDELQAAFQAALQPDVTVTVEYSGHKKTLTTDSGTKIPAYEASYIRISGQLERGAVTLRDGTPVDVIEDTSFYRTYLLADGTELLRVKHPNGPDHTYVGGVESFDDLSAAAQEQILAYYEQRGLLYDEMAELERLYALCPELGAAFRAGLVEQSVSPSASSDRVMYFLTTVTLPTNGRRGGMGNIDELRLCDAFDRETGAHIDTWDLFSVPKETVIQAILDKSKIDSQPLRAEMEAASWDGLIVISPEGLSVFFEPGTLPRQETSYGTVLDLDDISALMQDWAIPKSRT